MTPANLNGLLSNLKVKVDSTFGVVAALLAGFLFTSGTNIIGRTRHKPNLYRRLRYTTLSTCTLGTRSGHISAADGPIGLKFGLWLVLPIILLPEVNKDPARSAATTPNVESTLTLTLLRRP